MTKMWNAPIATGVVGRIVRKDLAQFVEGRARSGEFHNSAFERMCRKARRLTPSVRKSKVSRLFGLLCHLGV